MKKIILSAAMLGAMSLSANTASANTGAQAAFNAHYTVQDTTCTTCHTSSVTPKTTHTAFGTDWLANGGTKNAGPTTAAGWDALDAKYLNTYGPVKSTWTAPTTTTTPSSSGGGGGGGCIASSATTPLMMVLAMLSLGFFARRKKG